MKSFRSFFLTLGGLTFVAVVAVFTASIGIAIAGAISVLMFGHWLSALLTRSEARPVHAAYTPRQEQPSMGMRVWNDGKGTIIDM